ncbi:MAG TPA: hypothetical protein VFD69_09940 [Vicinamibacterales bacterium]|nr:hypothetical protein [Vicinamibacterales bacterium]
MIEVKPSAMTVHSGVTAGSTVQCTWCAAESMRHTLDAPVGAGKPFSSPI